MIVALKNSVDTILNKNNQGKITYKEFNSVLPEIVNHIQRNIFGDMRKMNFRKMRFQDTPNYGDEAGVIKQAQEYYISEKELSPEAGKVNLIEEIPDFFLFNSAFSDKAMIEKVDMKVFNSLKRISGMNATSCMPICTLNGNMMKVAPENTPVELVYFRKAKTPKLTYRVFDGADVIDDSKPDFQDLDIHPLMLHAVFIELLMYLGINLKDEFSVQLASNLMEAEQRKGQQ